MPWASNEEFVSCGRILSLKDRICEAQHMFFAEVETCFIAKNIVSKLKGACFCGLLRTHILSHV